MASDLTHNCSHVYHYSIANLEDCRRGHTQLSAHIICKRQRKFLLARGENRASLALGRVGSVWPDRLPGLAVAYRLPAPSRSPARSLPRSSLMAGRLMQLFPDWTLPSVPISLVYPSRRELAPAVRAFADFMRESAARGQTSHANPSRTAAAPSRCQTDVGTISS